MSLGGWLIWISLVECLDHIRCIHKVFGWFPTQCVRGVVKPFPFNKVEQSQSLVIAINPAVKDPMDFPLIGVIQLDQWWWVYCSVGYLTRASGFQQQPMEDRVNVGQS